MINAVDKYGDPNCSLRRSPTEWVRDQILDRDPPANRDFQEFLRREKEFCETVGYDHPNCDLPEPPRPDPEEEFCKINSDSYPCNVRNESNNSSGGGGGSESNQGGYGGSTNYGTVTSVSTPRRGTVEVGDFIPVDNQ